MTKSCGPSQQKLDGEERERESSVWSVGIHFGPTPCRTHKCPVPVPDVLTRVECLTRRFPSREKRTQMHRRTGGSTSIATLEAVCAYKQAGLAKRGLFQALWCENLEMLCPTKMVHILAKIVSVLLMKTIYSEKIGDVQHNSFDYRISIIVQGLHVFFDSFSDCLAVTTREGQVQNLIKDKTV